jgi:hypothetical protein
LLLGGCFSDGLGSHRGEEGTKNSLTARTPL